MKNLLLSIILLTTFASANNTTKSSIVDVTVYLTGAQISRTSTLKVPVGTTEFTFEKLSPYIQESSIQISGLKGVSILSINYGIDYLSKQNRTEEIKDFQTQIKSYNDQIQHEDNLIAGYNEELNVIQANRHLGNDSQVVNLEKLKQFTAYYRTRITEIKKNIYASEKKKTILQNDISDIQKQLSELNVNDKVQTGKIKLKLNTSTPAQLDLVIKYNVSNAGWFPIYDLKANKLNTPLELVYKAHVYQTTGSDWDNINLTLSTSDPTTNNIKPDMSPKYLNFINYNRNYFAHRATKNYNYKYNPLVKTIRGIVTDEYGQPLPGVNVIEKGTSNGTQTDFDGNYTLQVENGKELNYSFVGMQSETLPIHSSIMNVSLNEDASQLSEVVVVAYATGYSTKRIKNEKVEIVEPEIMVEQGIANVRFSIKKKYSIPTDGEVTVIEIENYSVPATYAYFTAPVLNENVFLTAKIGNWEQYNLLPAEANVYFEGSYSGKTNINPLATSDSLTVSLGVDPNVVITRTELKDFKKNQYIGSNKIVGKTYEIEIKNNKQSSIDLVLFDRIPISQNRDIKVEDIEIGKSTYNEEKGIMEWKVNLKPDDKSIIRFSYAIKYPKYKRINL